MGERDNFMSEFCGIGIAKQYQQTWLPKARNSYFSKNRKQRVITTYHSLHL
uniref:DMT904 n=1 Tax=Arundo donax TaxID=35708 RepID=A0A0A9FZN8_ARUDO